MGIVSKQLDHVSPPQADGTVKAREVMTDHYGRKIYHNVCGPDEATLEANMHARNMDPVTLSQEARDSITWVRNGNDPETFPLTDLTAAEHQKVNLEYFEAKDVVDDQAYVCGADSWVASLPAEDIAESLGISLEDANIVIERAVKLRDETCPGLLVDEAARRRSRN